MITALRSITGMISVIALCAAGAAAWLKSHDRKIEKKTEAKIVERSSKDGERRAAKAKQIQDAARAPGAAARLQSDAKTCADCR